MGRCYLLFLVIFLVTTYSKVVNAKVTKTNLKLLINKEVTSHEIKRTSHQSRQQSSCSSILNNYPSDCNAKDLLVHNVTQVDPSIFTLLRISDINSAYTQFCVAKCMDPIFRYAHCFDLSSSWLTYTNNIIRRGTCGKEGSDFCVALYKRRYSNDTYFINRLTSACPFTSAGVDCTSANSTCLQYLSDINQKMGCCTSPFLGDLSSCNLDVDDPCESVLSGFGVISPAVFALLFAVLAAIFV